MARNQRWVKMRANVDQRLQTGVNNVKISAKSDLCFKVALFTEGYPREAALQNTFAWCYQIRAIIYYQSKNSFMIHKILKLERPGEYLKWCFKNLNWSTATKNWIWNEFIWDVEITYGSNQTRQIATNQVHLLSGRPVKMRGYLGWQMVLAQWDARKPGSTRGPLLDLPRHINRHPCKALS